MACASNSGTVDEEGAGAPADAGAPVNHDSGSGPLEGGTDDGDFDTSQQDSGTPELEKWLLTIDNKSKNKVHSLMRISVDAATLGEQTEICADLTLPSSVPASNVFSSLTFNKERLYASGVGESKSSSLFIIDPCKCTATEVGRYGFGGMGGITSRGEQMFGISTDQDVFVSVNPATGTATKLANLDSDWVTAGLSWSGPENNTLWAIGSIMAFGASVSKAIEFDASGKPIGKPVALDYDFGSVGTEYHPGLHKLYACSDPGKLLEVNTKTGHVTVGPSMNQKGCNNLAAPYGHVKCVPSNVN